MWFVRLYNYNEIVVVLLYFLSSNFLQQVNFFAVLTSKYHFNSNSPCYNNLPLRAIKPNHRVRITCKEAPANFTFCSFDTTKPSMPAPLNISPASERHKSSDNELAGLISHSHTESSPPAKDPRLTKIIVILSLFVLGVVNFFFNLSYFQGIFPERPPSEASSEAKKPLSILNYNSDFPEYPDNPSEKNPFMFFHQRKAGGTTIRRALTMATNELNITLTFIPCKTLGVECQTYYTPSSTDFKGRIVYGGHLFYNPFIKTLSLHHSSANDDVGGNLMSPPEPKFTCLTIFREPISRMQSCWNYRFVQKNPESERDHVQKMAETSVKDLATRLPTARSIYGYGCMNEPMRIFSDSGQVSLSAAFYSSSVNLPSTHSELPTPSYNTLIPERGVHQ